MNGKTAIAAVVLMGVATMVARAQGGLVLNEVLFQPRSGEAEFVELYNPTAEAISLDNYMIIRWIGDSLGTRYPLPSHAVGPRDYVVLTKDAASVAANYGGVQLQKVVECRLPTYPNDGGAVVLADAAGRVVERLDYSPAMHSRLLRNKAGVSLERRSHERPCNEATNWFSAASTVGYATPTLPNSQSAEYLAEEARFALSSDIVSPDGDGYQDDLTIDYTLDANDIYASIEVYDASGHPVRRLLNNALLGTHGSLGWDGRGDGGKALKQGRYILIINLYDLNGTRQTIRRALAVVNP
ncbi:MAG: lamin tail domain-containing protein [Bacteroidales bacterium]|nr:lamin tail domain-containing protein [Bacteroidales bacterium]